MKNETKIKGDRNQVFQGIKKSQINTNTEEPKNKNLTIISILIAAVALIVTIIIGWDNIIKFFTK